ncbi:D-alanine--D-alanine ligase [Myxococcota bacterium]|nr:D-alanine--D-alanine ligase [Myxococcota bacterium]MBU1382747.1 D-alanine--D-alanine ligase [Myxococcota bacterium]MBU1498489.1 D-alanine--D-alanine ligase [Myxococcota bacterium]
MKVCVLMGGMSSEYDISVKSGTNVASGLAEMEHEVCIALVSRAGKWRFSDEYLHTASSVRNFISSDDGVFGHGEDAAAQWRKMDVEVVFPALHGPWGEDGRIQGFLDICGFPWVGSSVSGSAVSNDKLLTKYVLRANALPTADYTVLRTGYDRKYEDIIEVPCVLKSPCQGSSFGLAVVKTREDLKVKLAEIMELEGIVLIEKFVRGREITCGVLRKSDGSLQALPPTEIVPKVSDYFDFKAKYETGGSDEITPARITPEQTLTIQNYAVKVHEILGMGTLSRTDFILTSDDEYFILESNALPGFTQTSLYPQAAAVAGWSFNEIVDLLVKNAARPLNG